MNTTALSDSLPTRATVIGAGPVGCATAGHLARQGIEVAICDVDAERIAPLADTGMLQLRGAMEGQAPIALATTDIGQALRGVRFVVNATPGSAHEAVARAAGPHLEDGTLLLLQPGTTLAAVAFLNAARAAGFSGQLTLAETLNSIYTARLAEPGTVEVYAIKKWVKFAAQPAGRTPEVAPLLQRLFPPLEPCSSILEVGLHNVNAVVHPVITLLNAGQVERGWPFLFYVDGATPQVIRIAEAVDRERLAILDAFGLERFSVYAWYRDVYDMREPDLCHSLKNMPPYRSIAGPTSLNTRLLLEDIPTGVVSYCSLADAVGVPVPNMRAIVQLACTLYDTDFWAEGRTLRSLGLGGLDREGLLEAIGPASA